MRNKNYNQYFKEFLVAALALGTVSCTNTKDSISKDSLELITSHDEILKRDDPFKKFVRTSDKFHNEYPDHPVLKNYTICKKCHDPYNEPVFELREVVTKEFFVSYENHRYAKIGTPCYKCHTDKGLGFFGTLYEFFDQVIMKN